MKNKISIEEYKSIENRLFKIKLLYPLFGFLIYFGSYIFPNAIFTSKVLLFSSVLYLVFIIIFHFLILKTNESYILLLNSIMFFIGAIFVTVIVHFTGGPISPFAVLYFFIILNISLFRVELLSILASVTCYLLYTLTIGLEFLGIIKFTPFKGIVLTNALFHFQLVVFSIFFILVTLYVHTVINSLNKERHNAYYLREAAIELTRKIGEKSKIIKDILEIAIKISGGDSSSIIEYKDGIWKFAAWNNIENSLIKNIEDSINNNPPKNLEEIRDNKKTLLIKNTKDYKFWVPMSNTKSYIGTPIIENDLVVAVLNVDSNITNKFSETDAQNIETLSRVVSAVMERANLLNKTEELNRVLSGLSQEDTLTRLYNRRKLEEVLIYQINRYIRSERNFQIIFIDLDRFKLINDELGHLKGDEILIIFGSILSKHVRKVDYVFRYGGDEFVIILPDSPPPSVESVIKRLQAEFLEKFSDLVSRYGFGFSYGSIIFDKFYNDLIKEKPDIKNNDKEIYFAVLNAVDEELYRSKKTRKAI